MCAVILQHLNTRVIPLDCELQTKVVGYNLTHESKLTGDSPTMIWYLLIVLILISLKDVRLAYPGPYLLPFFFLDFSYSYKL